MALVMISQFVGQRCLLSTTKAAFPEEGGRFESIQNTRQNRLRDARTPQTAVDAPEFAAAVRPQPDRLRLRPQ
jgi:hypothetical protein